jgi:hypothetical protein
MGEDTTNKTVIDLIEEVREEIKDSENKLRVVPGKANCDGHAAITEALRIQAKGLGVLLISEKNRIARDDEMRRLGSQKSMLTGAITGGVSAGIITGGLALLKALKGGG